MLNRNIKLYKLQKRSMHNKLPVNHNSLSFSHYKKNEPYWGQIVSLSKHAYEQDLLNQIERQRREVEHLYHQYNKE